MIIALDLGTTVGVAAVTSSGNRFSYSRDLKPGKHENWAARFAKFVEYLEQIESIEPVKSVWYEEVRAHNGTDAAHVYGGFLATLGRWCDERGVPMTGVPVGTIKKFATGKGNASKTAVMAACADKFGVLPSDDNEADAVALREYVLNEQGL